MRGGVVQPCAVDEHFAALRLQQPRHDVQERRFSRSRRAFYSDALAAANAQRKVLQDGRRVVSESYAAQ